MGKIRLSRVESSAFKNSSYAGPSVIENTVLVRPFVFGSVDFGICLQNLFRTLVKSNISLECNFDMIFPQALRVTNTQPHSRLKEGPVVRLLH